MSSAGKTWKTSIGMKVVMALTGVILLGFITGHMIGNLQVLLGPEPLNRYAAFLQGLGELLWGVRIFMLVAFLLHIISSILLTLENRKARPVPYQRLDTVQASMASRTMIYTGILVAFFVVFHILHFTLGKVQPEYFHLPDATYGHDVYAMVVLGFQNTGYSILYIVLMLALGWHLSHAIASACETIGFNHPKYESCVKKLSLVVAWGIAIGYIVVPVSIMVGVVSLSAGGH